MENRQHNQYLITQIFVNSTPGIKMLMILVVTFMSFLLVSFFSTALAVMLYDISFDEISSLLNEDLINIDVSILKYLQITQSVALFIIPALILNSLLLDQNSRMFALKGKFSGGLVIMIIIVMIISSPFIDFMIKMNENLQLPEFLSQVEQKIRDLENNGTLMTEKLLSGNSFSDYALNLFMIAIIPALGEEFYFRGVLQPLFVKWFRNNHLGIITAALLFSAIHLQFYGFVPRFILGLFFGYLLYWGKNIWLVVFAHFLNNAIAVSLDFYLKNFQSPFAEKLPENLADKTNIVIISAMFSGIFIYIIYKFARISVTEKNIIV